MNLLAKIISIIFNPLVLSSPIAFALVYVTSGNLQYSLMWALVSLVFALIIAAFVYVGMKIGMFSNFDVSIRTQRKPVFIFAGLVIFLYILLILILHGPKVLLLGLGVVLLGTIAAEVINKKIKASMHLAVATAFSFVYAIFFGGYFWILPLVIPAAVAWSRIKLKRHSPLEVLVGAAFGLSLVVVFLLIVKY